MRWILGQKIYWHKLYFLFPTKASALSHEADIKMINFTLSDAAAFLRQSMNDACSIQQLYSNTYSRKDAAGREFFSVWNIIGCRAVMPKGTHFDTIPVHETIRLGPEEK